MGAIEQSNIMCKEWANNTFWSCNNVVMFQAWTYYKM